MVTYKEQYCDLCNKKLDEKKPNILWLKPLTVIFPKDRKLCFEKDLCIGCLKKIRVYLEKLKWKH